MGERLLSAADPSHLCEMPDVESFWKILAITAGALIGGCAHAPSAPQPAFAPPRIWDVSKAAGAQSGEPQVLIEPSATEQGILMETLGFDTATMVVPIFARHEGAPCVGMKSVVASDIPVGSIQLRVDDGVLYSIDEPGTTTTSGPALAKEPYTVTCGDRGAAIIAQVKAGHTLMVRQVSGSDPIGSTIKIEIGTDLLYALAKAGL